MTSNLRLTLMGGVEIDLEGNDLTGVLPVKMQALLAYLALEEGGHSRSHLAGLLWEKTEEAALRNLRVNLVKLRTHLNSHLLTTKSTLSFNKQAPIDLDVEDFEYALAQAKKADGAERRAFLREAVALYRGDFLTGLDVEGELIYDEWVTPIRERLRKKMLAALDMLVGVCLELGDNQTGIQYAEQLLGLENWREKSHRQLMRLYAANGQRAQALRQFEICRKMLTEEFGAEPTAVTQAVYERIQSLAEGQDYQVVLPRPETDAAVPFLAPIPIPHFTGRDDELDALGDQLLQRQTRRVLALVGMGGIGKTALATMLAHDLREAFPDGVLWANAATADPMSLAERWVNAYGFDFSQISRLEARAAALRDLLAQKKALIIFDDVTSPAWVRQFIPESGQCAVLLTTRNADYAHILNAHVEDVGALSRVHGRTLLAEIVGDERVAEAPDAADQICRLLHGLPLALAIAAKQLARRRRRSLSWLATRLQDEAGRIDLADEYGAVRASFALSWSGLDESQKRIFALLAVFEGRDFPAAALAAVAGMPPFPAQDRLDMLVNLSLLNEVGEERYRQHLLLKDYAAEKLTGDDEPFRRLVTYYQLFARQRQHDYDGLRPAWENLSAAVDQAHRLAMWTTVIEFTQLLRDAWFARGRYTEARRAFKRAKKAALIVADRAAQAQCLFDWGMACIEQSDYEEAQLHLMESLDLCLALAQDDRIADVKCELGRIALELGDYTTARQLLMDTLAVRKQMGYLAGEGLALYRLARVAYRRDEADTAVSLLQNALKIQTGNGDEAGRMPTMRLLATIALYEIDGARDTESAARYYEEVRAIAEKLGDENERALALRGLSVVYTHRGELAKALTFCEESEALLQRIGDRKSVAQVWRLLSNIRAKMGELETAIFLAQKTLKVSRELQDRLLEGFILFELGKLFKTCNQINEARDQLTQSNVIGKALKHGRLIQISQDELDSLDG